MVTVEGSGDSEAAGPTDSPMPGRQSRVGGIVQVRGDKPGVSQIHLPVGVDVPQRDVAVVGHDNGAGVPAVQGNQQGVEEIDTHPCCRRRPGYPARGGGLGGSGGCTGSFHDEIQRGHAGLDPEGRVHVGDQSRARDGQARRSGPGSPSFSAPASPSGAGPTRLRTRRNPRLPVDQQHRTGGLHPGAAETVEVDPGAATAVPGRIGGVPAGRVKTGPAVRRPPGWPPAAPGC